MRSLETAKALEAAFGDRALSHHAADRCVKQFEYGAQHAFVVLDLAVSRRILISKSFTAFNYFDEGVRRLESSGTSMSCTRKFFEQGLLFQEGPQHHEAKHALIKLLDREAAELEALSPRLTAFMTKRSPKIDSPLDFSTLFVRLCIGLVIARLTSVPLASAMRVLRARENIFYFYFHPGRQRRLNAVLAEFDKAARASGDNFQHNQARILAESLITMGYDPLIGSLCADLVDNGSESLASAPRRYCPTSFVSRVCVESVSIAGHHFDTGDICYAALVPAASEEISGSTFPFGLGAHTCIGKRFSQTVLNLAENVIQRSFPDGFKRTPQIRADGAFLAFERS